MKRQAIYFAHPLAGDVRANVKRAYAWLSWLMRSEPDVAFVAPWLACVAAGADDKDPKARERGLLDAVAVIPRCDGIVLCGEKLSNGMVRELNVAVLNGLAVYELAGKLGDGKTIVPPEMPWPAGRLLDTYRRVYPRTAQR